MSEYVSLTERMIKAFKKYGCFVFESTELEKVRDLIVKSEISRLVEIKAVDERYPYIYIVTASTKGLDRECTSIVESMLAKGEISQLEYKRYRRELIEQCIVSLERERVKEIIAILESYLSKVREHTISS